MKKIISTLSIALIIGLAIYFYPNSNFENTDKNLSESKKNVETYVQKVTSNKVFEIGFDKGMNEDILNGEGVYVIDSNNNIAKTTIKKVDNQLINILPPKNGYKAGSNYRLFINKNLDLENANYEKPNEYYQIDFEIENKI